MSGGEVILVVEDDGDLRESLCEVLEDEGYCAISASTGADALGQLRDGLTPTVILLDLMMPVMSGWEFREVQLQDPVLAPIPVVVMTASRNLKERPIQAAEIMFKPLQLDQLLSAVARAGGR